MVNTSSRYVHVLVYDIKYMSNMIENMKSVLNKDCMKLSDDVEVM